MILVNNRIGIYRHEGSYFFRMAVGLALAGVNKNHGRIYAV